MEHEPLQFHVECVHQVGDLTENPVERSDGPFQTVSRIFLFPFTVIMRAFSRVLRFLKLREAQPEVAVFPGRYTINVRRRSRFHRVLLSFLPHWFSSFLGCSTSYPLSIHLTPETRLSPSKSGGKGNKRKTMVEDEEDDDDDEDSHVLVDLLNQELLPEESPEVDPDYEPVSEETDSEEYATDEEGKSGSDEPSAETDTEAKVCVVDVVESIGEQSEGS